jgi:hypothetical protein
MLAMRTRRALALLVLGALLGTESGCSWIFVHKAPAGPVEPVPPAECTSSVASPVLDTVGAALLGIIGGAAIVGGATAKCGPSTGFGVSLCTSSEQQALIIGGGLLVLGAGTALAFSAAHGYGTTAQCRHLKADQLSCISGVEDACQSLKQRTP